MDISVNRICMACNIYGILQAFHRTCLTLASALAQVHATFPDRLWRSPLTQELQEAVMGLSIKMFSWDYTETVKYYELGL